MKAVESWRPARSWLVALKCLACMAMVNVCGNTARAADVARVEEDWQLVVNQPDVDLNGPQLTCVISPATVGDAYCAFDINYCTQPDYSAGGLQMHAWNPYTPIVTCNFPVSGVMQTNNETVTWTQTMSLADGVLTFLVVNGQSTTWGTFGGTDDESVSVNTTVSNLNAYDPNVSLENSGVSFASNLVASLTLTAVRWYAADGTLIQEITTPQVVHPQD
jgi:hypothetical protein